MPTRYSNLKVFVSSPCESLKDHRKEIKRILNNLGCKEPFLSEYHGSRISSPYNTCLKEVENCDLFILLLGSQYGWIPPNRKSSVTEIEYKRARKCNRHILVYKLTNVDYDSQQLAFIRKVENFKTGLFRRNINRLIDFESALSQDLKQFFYDRSSANKEVIFERTLRSEKAVKFGELKTILLKDKLELTNTPLLLIKARINYDREAGNGQIVKFLLNDYEFSEEDLVNKPIRFIQADARSFSLFNKTSGCWSLPYSPNFKDNYFDSRYKITNGDTYTYIFSLRNAKNLKPSKNAVRVKHCGLAEFEAHKNRIIIGKCEFIH